jgi:hypothetical protein
MPKAGKVHDSEPVHKVFPFPKRRTISVISPDGSNAICSARNFLISFVFLMTATLVWQKKAPASIGMRALDDGT